MMKRGFTLTCKPVPLQGIVFIMILLRRNGYESTIDLLLQIGTIPRVIQETLFLLSKYTTYRARFVIIHIHRTIATSSLSSSIV